MVQELLHTPFPAMVAICFWWILAWLVAGNIINFGWWVISAPFKGIALLWNNWRDDVRLRKEVEARKAAQDAPRA